MTISRYQNTVTATVTSADGDQIPYLRRRFLPVIDATSTARVHSVGIAELHRPDLIAATELGQAELSWVLADVNSVMRPSELCLSVGQPVRLPQASGWNIGNAHAQ